jgi:hypothetical protein
MEVLNELYVRNVKEILAEPTRRFSYTRSALSAPVTCNRVEQTLSTQLYSAILTRQEERKRLQGYARLSGLWVIVTAGSITKGASLYSIFSSSHHWFINQPFYVSTCATSKHVISNQNYFTVLPCSSYYYGARQ